MTITLSIYFYIIGMVAYITVGALLGIVFCWYRVTYKVLPGQHRHRESRPTFQYAYNKGWDDRVVFDYKRRNMEDTQFFHKVEPQVVELRGYDQEGDLVENLAPEHWAMTTENDEFQN